MHDWTRVVSEGPADRQFLRPVWFRAWETAYGDDKNWRRPVQYFSFSNEASCQGILPLATQQIGPFRFASLCGRFFPFRGIPFCGDPTDAAPKAVQVLDEIGTRCGIRVGPTPDNDPLLGALAGCLVQKNWKIMRKVVGEEFVIENPGSVEQFAGGLSSRRRQRVEYYWRRLCKNGPTELRHYNGGSATEWRGVFQDIRQVESASWVAESGEPRFVGPRNEVFWDILTTDDWFCRAIHVWLIYHAGHPVSFALTLDSGDTRYVFANSFDARMAEFSTGTKIYQQLIYDAFSRGLQRINIGLGDSGYKSAWGAQATSQLVEIIAFTPNLQGWLAYLAATAKASLFRFRSQKKPTDAASTSEEPSQSPSSSSEETEEYAPVKKPVQVSSPQFYES